MDSFIILQLSNVFLKKKSICICIDNQERDERIQLWPVCDYFLNCV